MDLLCIDKNTFCSGKIFIIHVTILPYWYNVVYLIQKFLHPFLAIFKNHKKTKGAPIPLLLPTKSNLHLPVNTN